MSRAARRGASAVEFALTLPILLALASAVVDYGWYLSQSINVLNSTREGLRVGAMVPYDDGPDAEAETWTTSLLKSYGIDCEALSCNISAAVGTVDGYDAMTLTVDIPYTAPVGVVPVPVSLQAELTMALEDQQD